MSTQVVLSSRDEAINAWATTLTLDSVQLDAESSDIISINGLLRHLLTQKHLRRFCVMFRVTGYKNKKREETIQLIVRRIRSEAVEKMLYPEDDSDISRRQQPPVLSEKNAPVIVIEQQQGFSSSSSLASNSVENVDAPPADNSSSPTTRSMSREAALGAITSRATTSNKARSKKRSKGSPPLSVTQQGTYYRAINVYFDELHRVDVSRLGEPPSMRDLDTLQFLNKDVYDNLLQTYLEMTIAADHIGIIAFSDNPYLQGMGLVGGVVPFASEFDVLTSEELKDTMAYINHWYRHAHRNSKMSGSHGNFEDFVGDKPFVYYYHLWLQEIPHLFALVVPTLPTSVVRESCVQPAGAPCQLDFEPIQPTTPAMSRRGQNKLHTQRVTSDSAAATEAMKEIGRAAGEKVTFLKTLVADKVCRNALQKEKDLLDLLEMYDKSLKRKNEDLIAILDGTSEDAENISVMIGMLKTKRRRVLESLEALP